ncbi:MAG: hypothetical protein ACLP01_05475 [Solirubrobacteraceae bacterium]
MKTPTTLKLGVATAAVTLAAVAPGGAAVGSSRGPAATIARATYPYTVAGQSESGYVMHPRTWKVLTLPSWGVYYEFSGLSWQHWGSSSTEASGRVRLCTEQLTDCRNGTVTIRLNHAVPAPEMNEYCWMTVLRSSIKYLVGHDGNPGEDDANCGLRTW